MLPYTSCDRILHIQSYFRWKIAIWIPNHCNIFILSKSTNILCWLLSPATGSFIASNLFDEDCLIPFKNSYVHMHNRIFTTTYLVNKWADKSVIIHYKLLFSNWLNWYGRGLIPMMHFMKLVFYFLYNDDLKILTINIWKVAMMLTSRFPVLFVLWLSLTIPFCKHWTAVYFFNCFTLLIMYWYMFLNHIKVGQIYCFGPYAFFYIIFENFFYILTDY